MVPNQNDSILLNEFHQIGFSIAENLVSNYQNGLHAKFTFFQKMLVLKEKHSDSSVIFAQFTL